MDRKMLNHEKRERGRESGSVRTPRPTLDIWKGPESAASAVVFFSPAVSPA